MILSLGIQWDISDEAPPVGLIEQTMTNLLHSAVTFPKDRLTIGAFFNFLTGPHLPEEIAHHLWLECDFLSTKHSVNSQVDGFVVMNLNM